VTAIEDTATPEVTTKKAAPVKKRRPVIVEYFFLTTFAVVLALLIRAFLGLVFFIPSPSMVPTLKVHDKVVVSRLSYRLHEVHRGDIVVFENPGWKKKDRKFPMNLAANLGQLVGIGTDKEENYIKRVVGLPGETVSGKDGKVYINGVVLPEPYLVAGVTSEFDGRTYEVPAGHYFMMGDNRGDSCDSRCFPDTTGKPAPYVAKDKIVGRAFLRLWPFSRIGSL
jgi:signal peptidase I